LIALEGGHVKKKVLLIITLAAVAILLSNALFTESVENRGRFLSQLIYSGLKNWHYSGKKIDDEFSKNAFGEFLEVLDPNKRFLLQKDIEELRRYQYEIDDQFADGSTKLMKIATNRLEQRIRQVMNFYHEILEKPFDFTREESLELDPDKRSYCSNMTELKEYWRKILKFRTLIRYINLMRTEKKSKPDAQLEEKARKATAKSIKNIFSRLLQTYKNDALSLYFNSLVQVYDPHTTYFLPLDKETFDMQMSGSFEGIGARLREEDGYVTVASIVPGGPSWKQKQLQPADAILKVGQGDEEPEDIVGMRVQDAVKLIRGKKGTLVKLTVKKPDGQIVVIPIVRDVVVLEETFARSAILSQKESGKTFGYIFLSRFYNDFNQKDGRNSTDDVKKELEKLKAKKVDGIILDLRNNTGGALRDALRMSGLFISKGPIVQVKDKKNGIQILKDPDPKTIYSGPLVVMINSLSASASEILAAALQDYGRAVIVGSNHSFGKGTVQAMVNLDRFISQKSPDEQSLGALTITVQKFYRINGTSIQQKGVTPDIILPDQFSALNIGEKHLHYSLNWDSIPAANYDKWSHHSLNIQTLAEKSRNRINKNPRFQLLNNQIQKLKQRRNETLQSLQLTQVMEQQEAIRKETETFNKSQEESCFITVIPSQEIEKKSSEQLFKIEKEREKEWFSQIDKDLLLNEAMAVLTDMLEMEEISTSQS
jgi:carboxyl-terminal processing protease